jgi:hypothetical protein
MRGGSQHKSGAKTVQLSSTEENQEVSQDPDCIASLYGKKKDEDEQESEHLK